MKDVWNRIEAWLNIKAPAIASDLRAGASDNEVSIAEQNLSIQFPEGFRESCHIHDGQNGMADPLMGDWQLLSLHDIQVQWKINHDLLISNGFGQARGKSVGPVKNDWWNPKWIPIAYNGAGDLQCLDFDPAQGGEMGQIVIFWHVDERRERVANNFRAWMESFANDLESGQYQVVDGMLVRQG